MGKLSEILNEKSKKFLNHDLTRAGIYAIVSYKSLEYFGYALLSAAYLDRVGAKELQTLLYPAIGFTGIISIVSGSAAYNRFKHWWDLKKQKNETAL